MAQLEVGHGLFATIDNADQQQCAAHRWRFHQGYVVSTQRTGNHVKTILLHRFLTQPARGLFVVHVNGNRLDNTRANLKVVARQAIQTGNAKKHSQYRGVCTARNGKWRAQIAGKHLGYFETEIEAAEAYDTAALARWGEYAKLNIEQEGER